MGEEEVCVEDGREEGLVDGHFEEDGEREGEGDVAREVEGGGEEEEPVPARDGGCSANGH